VSLRIELGPRWAVSRIATGLQFFSIYRDVDAAH